MTVAELRKALEQVPAEYEVSFGDEAAFIGPASSKYEYMLDEGGLDDRRPEYGCATREEHEKHEAWVKMWSRPMTIPHQPSRVPFSFA